MVDVCLTFRVHKAIRIWVLREVPESNDCYARTEVNWASWVAHCCYWWNASGKITKMSLHHAD